MGIIRVTFQKISENKAVEQLKKAIRLIFPLAFFSVENFFINLYELKNISFFTL